ncbi:MAG: hypothetical protein ACOYJQ_12490 [Pseudochelatococcus sp.]
MVQQPLFQPTASSRRDRLPSSRSPWMGGWQGKKNAGKGEEGGHYD